MKKLFSVLLLAVNSLTFIHGLGFLFGDDEEDKC